VYIVPNGAIAVVVPACTNRKSNSAARMIGVEPSLQVAVASWTLAPDAQVDGRTPKPKHAKPNEVNSA